MARGKWKHGQGNENDDIEFRQCAECSAWFTWREERDHLEQVHDVYYYRGKLVGAPKGPDALHVRAERLANVIVRLTSDKRVLPETIHVYRTGLLMMRARLYEQSQWAARSVVTGANNGCGSIPEMGNN